MSSLPFARLYAIACGKTREFEAIGNASLCDGRNALTALATSQEVAQMVIEEMLEDGDAIPSSVTTLEQVVVAVTV